MPSILALRLAWWDGMLWTWLDRWSIGGLIDGRGQNINHKLFEGNVLLGRVHLEIAHEFNVHVSDVNICHVPSVPYDTLISKLKVARMAHWLLITEATALRTLPTVAVPRCTISAID